MLNYFLLLIFIIHDSLTHLFTQSPSHTPLLTHSPTHSLTPFQVILLLNFVNFTPLSVGGYILPPWAQALGWLMALTPTAIIFCVASFKIISSASDYSSLTFIQVGCLTFKNFCCLRSRVNLHFTLNNYVKIWWNCNLNLWIIKFDINVYDFYGNMLIFIIT